ncbi:hypothetical protein JVT61DRAFT_4446 [Boletus reticuloceps]|uniref:Methyltransferase domain-containing protein n=1 Tax=Boletus reticuloceps TaxID=495285 RepID=A0A8I2YKP1_9AGAM|nr:hypothetical protein JVT61DRAFT_4446 [Boletus reticuloceps]
MTTPVIVGLGAVTAALVGRHLIRNGILGKVAAEQWVKGGFKAKMDRKEAIAILGLKILLAALTRVALTPVTISRLSPYTRMMSTVDFDPSLLGTKDHWDQRYSEELVHYYESGLEGEAWFGEEPVLKMVEWALTHVPPTACPNVLDVGMGNGHLLFAMVDAGYDASRLTGIDYSRGSVDLSIAIAKQRDVQDEGKYTYANVTFAVCDFLDPASSIRRPSADVDEESTETTNDGVWDLVLDKGTFDAMSLMPDEDERGTVSLERYVPACREVAAARRSISSSLVRHSVSPSFLIISSFAMLKRSLSI